MILIQLGDCSLKEKRPLVLLVRETPMNLIHLKNMELVTMAGATVFPAAPAFWHKPNSIDELVDSLVDRLLTHLKVKDKPSIEWTGEL